MKMFLTRLGYGSKAVVTGDVTQVDLPAGKASGLKEAQAILANIPASASSRSRARRRAASARARDHHRYDRAER
jgi:phosphate starvation-inducible PhoH-like protein